MNQRPRASLGRVLDDLGDTLLELLCGDPEHPGEIGGVVIDDPVDEPAFPPQAIALGVGVTADGLADFVARMAGHGVAGVVVRSMEVADVVRRQADASGLAVLGLRRGATWAQLTALLRSVLAYDDLGTGDDESLGGLPSGDLFAVANAVAALLDAPITIEDRNSRVLAFSGRQEEADPSRVETVIGRQVPERYARLLTELGVFRELYRQHRPVVIDPRSMDTDAITRQRVAIAVRAGDEVLGSIWAVMDGELTPERTAALTEAAQLVALHLLRVRAGADVRRRLRTDLVSTALERGAGASDALVRLGLSGRAVIVLAASLPPDDERVTERAAELDRLADAMAVHLTATVPGAAVAPIGGVVYALVPVPSGAGDPEERALRLSEDFRERVGANLPAVVAVGSVGPTSAQVGDIVHSRAVADRVLRVLREGHLSARVARLADVQTQSLLLELRDLATSRGEKLTGPVAALIEYDERSAGGLVESLEAWLDAQGDVAKAAGALFIHQNTLRYRLRRITAITGLDLTDPEQRFAAMLQLRVLAPR
ncbi:PucR family transcriptional regulator [Nocardioides sp. Kera G14]|uniref:PucR family transcriptional regulator n=1 Tax=Nocardioides sp. Kera G14 TaxID=2884264 RepID=UPI001D107856|nr:helix-turn-helix domain-containing protein [Nocardioides sp. Kera G14]UDY23828.1 helix-turn-helix domain-containing protein [Nocardioides sp. Kera G14]